MLERKELLMQSQKLNSLQLELLNIYSFKPEEEDLPAVKKSAQHFSEKLQKSIQKSIDEKQITEEDLNNWVNE